MIDIHTLPRMGHSPCVALQVVLRPERRRGEQPDGASAAADGQRIQE